MRRGRRERRKVRLNKRTRYEIQSQRLRCAPCVEEKDGLVYMLNGVLSFQEDEVDQDNPGAEVGSECELLTSYS